MEQFLHIKPSPRCFDEIIRVEVEMPASGVVDLYERMLHKRAAKGISPVLYISSRKDLESSVQMLLDQAPETKLAGRRGPRIIAFRRRVMTQ